MIQRRTLLGHGLLGAAAPTLVLLNACGGGVSVALSDSPPPSATRRWKMGFSGNPPRPDAATLLRGVDAWSTRADLAIIHEELPWAELLRGTSPDAILDRDKLPLFAQLGLTDSNFVGKPALTEWDALFARRLVV